MMGDSAELYGRGLEILIRELGYVDAMRFILQYDTGQGDYTKERHQFLPDWTVEEFVREADKLVQESKARE
jgi:hypothetical protein